MMKTTKTELKMLIKECLLEILQEGLGNVAPTSVRDVYKPAAAVPLHKSIDKISYAESKRSPTPALKDAIRREAGGNKLMESIFADTAATTLPQMLNGENSAPRSGGLAERVAASKNPEEIFGEDAASKWATLAFADTPASKNRE